GGACVGRGCRRRSGCRGRRRRLRMGRRYQRRLRRRHGERAQGRCDGKAQHQRPAERSEIEESGHRVSGRGLSLRVGCGEHDRRIRPPHPDLRNAATSPPCYHRRRKPAMNGGNARSRSMSYDLFLPVFGAFARFAGKLAGAGLAATLASVACAQAPAPPPGGNANPPAMAAAPDDSVTLNFVNADIDAVVKAIAELTGRNFVVDPKIKGTVNIVSARPVPKSLVYPTLLSALRMQGIVAIEGDNVVKLVPEADARTQAAAGATNAGGDNRLVTRVVTLRYESAVQLVNVLRPLIAPNNTIAAYPASNALVITDYADNLRRIERVIASPIDLVATVNRLLNETGTGQPVDPTQRVMLVADPRSNSVLIRADNPAR